MASAGGMWAWIFTASEPALGRASTRACATPWLQSCGRAPSSLSGLFAISEALVMIGEKMIVDEAGRERALRARWADTVEGLRMSLQKSWHIVWTAFVGLLIGITPGAGASIASFVAYQQSRLWSKTPELYGKGIPEGVIAPESANNGVTSGTVSYTHLTLPTSDL